MRGFGEDGDGYNVSLVLIIQAFLANLLPFYAKLSAITVHIRQLWGLYPDQLQVNGTVILFWPHKHPFISPLALSYRHQLLWMSSIIYFVWCIQAH